MSDNKYKLFRNFMVNELGISRDDIKEWTMEATKETVIKILHGYDVKELIQETARRNFNSVFNGNYEAKKRIEEAVASMLSQEYKISIVKIGENNNAS